MPETRYVKSREGRGREEKNVTGCTCGRAPLLVNVREGRTIVRSYCARCEQSVTVASAGASAGVWVPFGAFVEKDRPWQPRDPNEKY